MNRSKSDLNPWRVVCGHLFDIDSYYIPEIIDKTGMVVDWSLTDRQDYSHKYRKAAYRPRINAAYELLSDNDKLRVSYTVVSELVKFDKADYLNKDLQKIGWSVENEGLFPIDSDVREIFFPKSSQHDAYIEIRRIVQEATTSIIIVDPYLDSSIFIVLKTGSSRAVKVRLLTFRVPIDFVHEAQKFLSQYKYFTIELRKTKEFHDRFIEIDAFKCWHIGCSLKDAGNKAFMISKIEDDTNKRALMTQIDISWSNAQVVSI